MVNQIQLAAKMYDARDTMKRFFGDKYPAKIAEHRGYIESQSKKTGTDTLHATMEIMRILQEKAPNSGMSQALILAACVEMIEPGEPDETLPTDRGASQDSLGA